LSFERRLFDIAVDDDVRPPTRVLLVLVRSLARVGGHQVAEVILAAKSALKDVMDLPVDPGRYFILMGVGLGVTPGGLLLKPFSLSFLLSPGRTAPVTLA
jgi:hypothetical protein